MLFPSLERTDYQLPFDQNSSNRILLLEETSRNWTGVFPTCIPYLDFLLVYLSCLFLICLQILYQAKKKWQPPQERKSYIPEKHPLPDVVTSLQKQWLVLRVQLWNRREKAPRLKTEPEFIENQMPRAWCSQGCKLTLSSNYLLYKTESSQSHG